jgi:hypothetical protein
VKRLAILLLTAVTLTACGGGDGESLTREEYTRQADAICSGFNERIDSLDNPANLHELGEAADRVLPIYEEAIADLRELRPPARDEETADQWLDQLEVVKEDLEEVRDRAKDRDEVGLAAPAARAQQDNARAAQLATLLGMSVCNMG